jgi:predicted membrane channel-forming protein YqfA (hemolysin III family)
VGRERPADQAAFAFIRPLVWGGLAYSLGAALELLHRPVVVPGVVHEHEVFHLAVLAGALSHRQFVLQFAAGGGDLP